MGNPIFGQNGAFAKTVSEGQNAFDPTYQNYQAQPGQQATMAPAQQYQQAPGQNYLDASNLNQAYHAPSADGYDTNRMTYEDVLTRTGMLFVVFLLAAASMWIFVPVETAFSLMIPAAIASIVMSFAISLSKLRTNPLAISIYAIFQGALVGSFSLMFEMIYPGIVIQAVTATLCTFAVVLIAYRSKKIRVTPKFRRAATIAIMAYGLFCLVNFVFMLFGTGFGFRSGGLGLAVGAIGVILAVFSLMLDFDSIERGVTMGAPKAASWTAAFGLLATLIWLYVEILRIISILRD